MKGFIYSTQLPMFGHRDIIGYGSKDFNVKEIERKLSNKVIKKNHYSKKVYLGTYIHLGVFIDGEFLGVLQYGHAMNPAKMGTVVKGTERKQYLELNRMWLDDIAPRNSESKAISYSIKYIKNKLKTIKWIQSFADERCGGLGIVYQACSFRYYGTHKALFWETEQGEIFHDSMVTYVAMKGQPAYERAMKLKREGKLKKHTVRQFRYIKFLDKSWIDRCLYKEKPYLKHYNND